MFYRIATCISFPWSAPRKTAQPRTKRGTKPQDAVVRVWRGGELPMTRSGGHIVERVSERNCHSSRTWRRERPWPL